MSCIMIIRYIFCEAFSMVTRVNCEILHIRFVNGVRANGRTDRNLTINLSENFYIQIGPDYGNIVRVLIIFCGCHCIL